MDTTAEAKLGSEEFVDRSVTDWYKDAIIYQLHVKAFQDSTGDGVGDFAGLIQRLDYIESLGVNTVWLLPFYPSPLKDDGYDIADYQSINPNYGDMEQFESFIAEAHRRGMRVITELVINHTSDQHPWFERARAASQGSSERDFYVWSDTDTRYRGTRIIFIDTESSNWTWDPVAKAYFWHRFYAHQPDLNFENPQVFDEVTKALRFWLDKGVDGLRLDAVPYLCEREGTNNENLPETHDVLRRVRATIDDSYPDRMLLAEANQWPEDTRPYFGDGDECHMAFHFPLMPRMYMALAQEDRHPITDILRQTPEIPESCQWAIFLRNHDELTLEMVTDEERDYLWRVYATDSRARLNLGIRRRLAPLMDNDRRKIELMNALLMSMPGTPVIYYGDEIGMGDNIYLGDRDGVRTPMQWSADRNGGFSRADPQRLYLPVIMDPLYGYQALNVEAEQRDSASLLNWMRRLIQVRKQHRAFGRGSLSFLYPGNRKIVAYVRELGDEQILCVANLSASAQCADLDLSPWAGAVPVELLGRSAFPPIGTGPYMVMLQAYGFFWFLLTREAELPRWYTAPPQPLPEFLTLVLRSGLDSAITQRNQHQIENEVLPHYLVRQRWFSGKDSAIAATAITLFARFEWQGTHHLLTFVDVNLRDGRRQRYFLPLSARWGGHELRPDSGVAPYTLAKLREGPRVGAIFDSANDETLAVGLVNAMARGEDQESAGGKLRFSCSLKIRDLLAEFPEATTVRGVGVEQSNSSVIIGDRILLKIYRRPASGVQPELEVGRYLTEEAHFDRSPALLGVAESMPGDGAPTAIAAAFEVVENQGDAWGIIVEALARHLQQAVLTAELGDKRSGKGLSARSRGQLRESDGTDAQCLRGGAVRSRLHAGVGEREPYRPVGRACPRARRGSLRSAGVERPGNERRRRDRRSARHAQRGHWLPRGVRLHSAGRPMHSGAWRLPSRSAAGQQDRRVDHRLRGRAAATAGGAPREDIADARRRRHAALLRLCRMVGVRSRREPRSRSGRRHARSRAQLARCRNRRLPVELFRILCRRHPLERPQIGPAAARSLPAAQGVLRDRL